MNCIVSGVYIPIFSNILDSKLFIPVISLVGVTSRIAVENVVLALSDRDIVQFFVYVLTLRSLQHDLLVWFSCLFFKSERIAPVR